MGLLGEPVQFDPSATSSTQHTNKALHNTLE